ncbi:RIP metalloprotease RseP [Marinomonas flavescens]|uniref:RIP metalloprotease RseP n=1 Tax=Marinomonas flavescens TaxID=2529379 RepID=UPI001055B22B|nr:RIP metalloprotease RseP [Marinomonas flavescens]
MIQNILSIVISLGVLITFHEFGHYFIARKCGVKVLRFSIGFGKPIYRFVAKTGTEFTLAMIPLGGYVRMLDEREGNVPAHLKSEAFNNKSVWQRFAIVAAGPIANFILAIVIYAIVALMGIQSLTPKVGHIQPQSPIAQTNIQPGDELLSINNSVVSSWEDVNLVLADLIGASGTITVRYQDLLSKEKETDTLTLNRWMAGKDSNNLIGEFGLTPWQPKVVPVIAQVVKNGAAEKAGFQVGDKIIEGNGKPIDDWGQFVTLIQNHPGSLVSVDVMRSSKNVVLMLLPGSIERNGDLVGYAGLAVVPPVMEAGLWNTRHFGPIESLTYGAQQTWKMTALTVSSIGKMFQGLISIDNLSGPITIAKVASASADSGLQSFLKFMAYLSVSLGVLNLLPIPMLDGGHLMFFGIEAIRRKPVSEKIQSMAYRVGAFLLFTLMAIAIFNDIARL